MSNKLLLAPSNYDPSLPNYHASFSRAHLPAEIRQLDRICFSHCHTALLSAGRLWTVGSNEETQLGRLTDSDLSAALGLVKLTETVKSVAVTTRSTIVVTESRNVIQFGNKASQARVVYEPCQEFSPFEVAAVGNKYVVLGHSAV